MDHTYILTGINRLIILLILLMLFLLPGTIMGWIAAGRIRNSEGRLYGLRLAAFAALFIPVLILVVVSIMPAFIGVRIAGYHYDADDFTMILVAFVIAATFLIFSIKLSQSLYCRLHKGVPVWKNFRERINVITIVTIVVLWWGAGIVVYLQRPQEIGAAKMEKSPDGKLIATGTTWHRNRIFSADKTNYLFQVHNQEGGLYKSHAFHILPTTVPVMNAEEYDFGKNGAIQWSNDSREVRFLLKDEELYSTELHLPDHVLSAPNPP